MLPFNPARFINNAASGVLVYQGPGDIVSGAQMWGSTARAYTAAFAIGGTAVMDLTDQSDANAITINILPTGFVDINAITTWVAAHTVTTIKISKVYDQTGNGNHWTNATTATRPTLTLSALNGLPGITGVAASNLSLSAPGIGSNIAVPYVFVSVHKKTGTGANEATLGFNSSASFIGGSNNLVVLTGAAGTSFSVAATNGSFYSAIGLVNGASSVLNVNGVETTGTTDSTPIIITAVPRIVRGNGGGSLDGVVMEVGLWPATVSSGNRTLLNTNIHGSSGYNF